MIKNKLFIVLITAILIALGAGGWAAYSYYKYLKQPVYPITHAVPVDAVAIIKSGSVTEFISKARASGLSEMLDAAAHGQQFSKMAAIADSLAQFDLLISDLLDNKFLLAVVPCPEGFPDLLISIEVGKTRLSSIRKGLAKTFPESLQMEKEKAEYNGIYKLSIQSTHLWFYLSNGIFTIGDNPLLVFQSYQALNSKTPLTYNPEFAKVEGAAGKKVDAVLLLNNSALKKAVGSESQFGMLFQNKFFNSWSALDIAINKEKLMLSGFTLSPENKWITNQNPVKSNLAESTSYHSDAMFELSLHDAGTYLKDLGIADTINYKVKNNGTLINYSFNLKDNFLAWFGNEMVVFPKTGKAPIESSLLVFPDIKSDTALTALASFITEKEGFLKIRTSGIFDRLTANFYHSNTDSAYLVIAGKTMVISESLELTNRYLQELTATVKKAADASIFNENSNLSVIYNHRPNNNKQLSDIKLPSWTGFLEGCNRIILQYSGGDEMIYTHGSIEFSPFERTDSTSENIASTPELSDSTVSIATDPKPEIAEEEKEAEVPDVQPLANQVLKPVLLQAQSGGSRILAIPAKGKVDFFTSEGSLMWSFATKGQPTGDIFEIIVPENGKKAYAILTNSHLHLIGNEGKEMKGYPVKLPGENAGKSAIVDYNNRRDYRIIYPGTDGRIYNITMAGKELPDWNKPKTGTLHSPAQFIRTGGKDYLLFSHGNGKLLITDRRGRERIKIPENFRKADNAPVFENKTNSKGLFITANEQGQLVYISENGLISHSDFTSGSNGLSFNYLDFDNDNSFDFCFISGSKLLIYSRMKRPLVTFERKKADFGQAFIYQKSSGAIWIALRDKRNGDIFIIRDKNSQPERYTLKSETDPLIFNPGGRKPEVMVTMSNGKPVFTPVKKQ